MKCGTAEKGHPKQGGLGAVSDVATPDLLFLGLLHRSSELTPHEEMILTGRRVIVNNIVGLRSRARAFHRG